MASHRPAPDAGAQPAAVDARQDIGVPDPYPVRVPVVALVASAGGVDALSCVLDGLPADLPAAVLVALHQDPTRPSELASILDVHARLPVRVAADRTEVRPGQVLIVPPGHHLLVTAEARVGLVGTGPVPPPRPSVDLLLATLAVTCGSRALAVVLTGGGHDGQVGVQAIARCGGTVMAQDPASARSSAMPSAAIATGTVRRILGLGDIAAAIVEWVTPA